MLLEPKDFATALGIKPGTLRQHIHRGYVAKSGSYIDTEVPGNREYIQEKTDNRGLDITRIPKKEKKKKTIDKVGAPQIKTEQISIDTSQTEEVDSLTMAKRKADLQKAETEAKIKSMQLQKMSGELIPIELMQSIFTINLQGIFRSFEKEAEVIATVFCEIMGGGGTELNKLTKELTEHIHKAIQTAKVNTESDIKAAIKEYSQIRNRNNY